jgi:predicted DNA-binding transcriptional regulator YafY
MFGRSGRLLSILLALQTRGRLTASALAAELEVSARTIQRDMEALSMAGVPVYAERGAAGGWHLPSEYRLGPRGLDSDELHALFLAAPGTVLGDLGLDRASESALTKLLLAVPADNRRELAGARQKLLVDLSTWRRTEVEPAPHLAALYAALLADRQVALCYRRADGVDVQRTLHPLGLVAKGRTWYLVAGAGSTGGEPRTYRVSRVLDCSISEARAEVPSDFDLASFWDASKLRLVEGVPRFSVCLRVQPASLPQVTQAGRWSRVVSIGAPGPGGWTDVELQFELEDDACALVLSLGPRVELVGPPHLRRRVALEAAAAAQLYV